MKNIIQYFFSRNHKDFYFYLENFYRKERTMKRREFIKKTSTAAATISIAPITFNCSSRKFDYLFMGGNIIDGTGGETIHADLAVKGNKIAGIGKFNLSDAKNIVDIQGKVITPGFIDIHSHTDTKLFVNAHAESKITQGVTSELYGMDGDSVAPLTEEMRKEWEDNVSEKYGYKITWKNLPEFYNTISKNGHALNFGTMIGQGTLRDYVIGKSDRVATKEDIQRMQQLLKEAVDAGACGISSGLEYTPGNFATTEEISELVSILKGKNFPYTTHMRNEGDRLIEAVEEAIKISNYAEVPLHISHLKVEGKRNWHKADLLFETIASAEKEGIPITFDRYTYIAYNTGLSNLFPLWAREGGTDKFLERLSDKKQLTKIESYTRDKIKMLGSWNSCLISTIYSKEKEHLQGKRLPEIAEIWKCDPFEAAVRLIEGERVGVSMVGFGMSEENTERILAHPNCVIASDGSALAISGPLSKGNPHPRNFGTFPRAIAHYVNKRQIVTLPEMIRKMTSKPAEIIGLKNRGKIAEGYFADLVVFSPGNLKDMATFEKPKQYSQGIEHVFVNGTPVITESKINKNLPGRILKSD